MYMVYDKMIHNYCKQILFHYHSSMQENTKIVLIGIWWTGMSGVAGMFLDLWYKNIVGIDSNRSQLTDNLESQGIKIICGHWQYEVQQGDCVIYSAAAEDSPEVQQAYKLLDQSIRGMVVCNYFQFLGEISKYCQTLAIAGTNGKSSTTALALYAAKTQMPDFVLGILGALMPDCDNKSYAINPQATNDIRNIFDHILTGKWLDQSIVKKYVFIVEACEYKRHFLHLDPDYTLITSIALDHTDYYKDIEDYRAGFVQLINKTKKAVFCPAWLDIDWIPAKEREKCHTTKSIDIDLEHVFGHYHKHNAWLTTPALTALWSKPIDNNTRKDFHGLWRRMEYLWTTTQWAKVYSDYAHMASSIDSVYHDLQTHYPDKKICALFQPHQVQRILQSWEEFSQALRLYNSSGLYQIYTARESQEKIYTYQWRTVGTAYDIGQTLARDIGSIYYIDFDRMWNTYDNYNDDWIVVILTAGDLDYYVRNVMKDK